MLYWSTWRRGQGDAALRAPPARLGSKKIQSSGAQRPGL